MYSPRELVTFPSHSPHHGQVSDVSWEDKEGNEADIQIEESCDETGTINIVVLGSIAAFLLILVIIVGIYSCSVWCKKKEEVRVEENPVYDMSNYEDNTYIKDSNSYYRP